MIGLTIAMYRKTIKFFHESDRTLTWLFLSISGILLASYLSLLSFSVSAIAARKAAERDLVALSGTLAELESRHVVLDARVTLSLARNEGFTEVSPSFYVERVKPRQAFTLNTRQY